MTRILVSLAALAGLLAVTLAPATAMADLDDKPHKIVIQVSSDDPVTHKLALNNAVNLQKALGSESVAIEIVAYGPGLSIMTAKSPESGRIPDLAMQDISFSACGNTKAKMEANSGKSVELVEGVHVVQAGVMRIMELQEQGYTYIRP